MLQLVINITRNSLHILKNLSFIKFYDLFVIIINQYTMLAKSIFCFQAKFYQYAFNRVFFSSTKMNIFQSNYHLIGPNQFRKTRTIEKVMANSITNIQALQKKLDAHRNVLVQTVNLNEISQKQVNDSEVSQYIQLYQKLIKTIEGCQINNEWVYNIISWYNMTSFYKQLVQRLLEAGPEEIAYLVKALHSMNFQWNNPNGYIDEEITKNYRLKKFYKNLQVKIDIGLLRKIDGIIKTPLSYEKRKYFEAYLHSNFQSLLKNLDPKDTEMVGQLIWLMQASMRYMNDDEIVFSKLQKYLLTTRLPLRDEDYEKLMSIYCLKGNINKYIYNVYIKSYLLMKKVNNAKNLVEGIKFLICSQAEDHQLLKKMYDILSSVYEPGKLQQQTMQTLHIYTHYLRIKEIDIKLQKKLETELQNYCKSKNSNSITQYFQKLKQGKKQIKLKYVSSCCNIQRSQIKQLSPEQKCQFQKNYQYRLAPLAIKQYKIYQKINFCCLELDYCLHKQQASQFIDFESDMISKVFGSGKLTRQTEIKSQILEHYGIKTKYYNPEAFKSKGKINEVQSLMKKRLLRA